MKVLLDTNIIIHREAACIKNSNIGRLFLWLETPGYQKCVHPITRQEIAKNINHNTSRTFGIKLDSYHELRTQAPLTPEIQAILDNDQSENDHNDTLLLNEVLQKRVDILLTEDNGIHAKSENLNISEKVLKIDDFLHKMANEYPDFTEYKVLSVHQSFFGCLDIQDPFFDSLKENYPEFERWFAKKADEMVYVSFDEEHKIVALLYLKVEGENENYLDITPQFGHKKRLKIGTFKVKSTGYKLGERFLKIVFDNALKQRVEEIYVTVFKDSPQKIDLVNLLENWGFAYHGGKSPAKEQVYVRRFARYSDVKNIKGTYPFLSRGAKKFIVPIRPKYHTELLPDSILSNENPEIFLENKGYRNAICKVYTTRSVMRDMNRGDIIIFYRSSGKGKWSQQGKQSQQGKWSQPGAKYTSVVTTIGIVDSVITEISNEDKFIQLCRTRSVFSAKELSDIWNEKYRRPFVVNFLYVHSFPKPFLNLKSLREEGIIENAPVGIDLLSDGKFAKLMEITNANHLIVD